MPSLAMAHLSLRRRSSSGLPWITRGEKTTQRPRKVPRNTNTDWTKGTDMIPTQIMEAEHRLIETVVKGLGGVAAAVELGERPAGAMLAKVVEFLRIYADQIHHGKE